MTINDNKISNKIANNDHMKKVLYPVIGSALAAFATSIILITFISLLSLAHATPNFLPGLIPLEFGQRPATDLIYNGKLLSADDAYKMVVNSNGKFDLSKLNPDDTSELWSNKKVPASLSNNESEIEVKDSDKLNYLSPVASRSGNFRFTVEKESSDGLKKSFAIMLNKNIHNVLLRKSLLEKIGYNVPSIKYLAKIKIKFMSYMEKELFFDKLAEATFGDPSRWIVNYKDHLRAKKNSDDTAINPGDASAASTTNASNDTSAEEFAGSTSAADDDDASLDDKTDPDDVRDLTKDGPLVSSDEIELQDVVIMDDQDHLYNLALGYLPSSVIQGRRILNSLLIPYSFVDVPESVNLFNWFAGRVVNNQVQLAYETAEEFTISFEDALWMLRKILSLHREDFIEIVKSAHLPTPVAYLLVEKLISRRNQLVEMFKLGNEFNILKVNNIITSGEYLKKGKLLKEKWDGYASRFSFGDPESPLSRSEIFAFIKSKAMSTAINSAIGIANKYMTDITFDTALRTRQEELFYKQVGEYLRTGKIVPIPLGIWAYPIFGAKIIASRNVIAGNYLGTDNAVQLADAVGFNVEAGVFLNVEGINAGVPLSVSSKIKGTFTRTYTHLRPIRSFKASLKYPFKNILVPLLQNKLGHFFDDLLSGNLETLKPEEKQKKIEKVMSEFKEQLSIGESLLITDSVGAGINVNAGLSLYQIIKAQAEFGATQAVISRLHIHRKDENTIQVYRDLGNVTSLILSFNFKAVVPILSVSAKFSAGTARIKFYSLNINENEKENPDFLKNIQALKSVLLNNSLERAASIRKPHKVKHTFLEAQFKAGIFFFQIAGLSSQTEVEVTHPKG
ncbi:MAG: hypothetical protein HQK51_15850, partial [Oligoflexia bacterium]|nr:hypothetical protein [Oligoflexia bacterium]